MPVVAITREMQLAGDLQQTDHIVTRHIVGHARLRAYQDALAIARNTRRFPNCRIRPPAAANRFHVKTQGWGSRGFTE